MSRYLFPVKAHADCDVKAVEILRAFVTLRYCDVDGDGQKDGHVHRDHRPGSVTEGPSMITEQREML